MRKRKSKNLIIVFVFIALFVMTTGYSIYEKRLSIGGFSRIDYKNWNIHISNIEMIETDGGVDVIAPSYTNTTAKFNSRITKADGYIKYKITIKNDGTIDGVLGAINITDTENSVISYEVTGIRVDDELRAHQTKDIYVKATYDSTKIDTATTSVSNVSVNLTFVQLDGYVPQYITPSSLISNTVTSGDGLYADPYETGNYIYRGATPENYITFNGEEAGWRIMSIENDGTIKIIRNTSIGNMAWDAEGTRNKTTSTYCTKAAGYGCNAWASTQKLGLAADANFIQYNPNGNKNSDTEKYEGTVTQDASLNTYLNTTYYNGLTETAKSQIVSHDFYVSGPGTVTDIEGITTDSEQVKDYVWNGNIALMTAIEYMKGSTNAACSSLKKAYNSDSNCGTNNWLKTGNLEWTLSPSVDSNRSHVWFVNGGGPLYNSLVYLTRGVRPVLYLSSDIHLEGSGTLGEPYTITAS